MISKEIEKSGIPVAFITAMISLAEQENVNRIVEAVAIPHPCGDPRLPEQADLGLRRKIVECALEALQTDVDGPMVFKPEVKYVKR